MAKASRGRFQQLFRVVPCEAVVGAGITKMGRRMALGEQAAVERGLVVELRQVSRKLMHSLEPLDVENNTADATRSCQGRGLRGLSLAAGTHGLGHCTSRVCIGKSG